MISPRWRKVLRDLWINKTRTVLVILSIAVGVFAIGLIGGSRVILSKGLNESYAATSPADVVIVTEPFEESLLERIRNIPEVGAAEGRRNLSVRVKVGGRDWQALDFTAIPDFNDIQINKVTSEGGAWPPPEHEMLVERASIEFLKATVGDTVLVEGPDGKQRQMRIAGLAYDLSQPQAVLANRGFGYITFDTLEWLGSPRNYDQLYITVLGDTQEIDEIEHVANLVRDRVEESGRLVLTMFVPVPGQHPVDTALQPMLLLLGALGLLALALSGFLVVNTVSALLTQQIRQIGVMKAIGARTGQIAEMYFGTVLIFGLLSLLVAVPLGAVGAYAFSGFIAHFINSDIGSFNIPREVLLTEIAVGMLVPMLAALWPVLSGTRVTVREAISAYGLSKGYFGTGLIDRVIGQIRGLPRPLLLSLRNTFRRKGRLILTLLTLTMSSAIFVVVMTLRSSLLLTLDDALSFWNYDVAAIFNRPYRVEQIDQVTGGIPGLATAESWGIAAARRVRSDETESDSITTYGLDADTELLQPTIVAGRWLVEGDENAIVVNTDLLRDEPDIEVGDELVLKIEGKESRWLVVGIVRGLLTGPVAFANYSYLARLTGDMGRAAWVLAVTEERDADAQTQVAKMMEEEFKSAGIQVNQVITIATVRRQVEFFFNIIVAFLAVMVMVLGVVGCLGLMGTMSINVMERTREIGVMRAIGASDGAVLQIFLVEGLLISLMSWAAGTLLAIPLSRLLSDAVGNALFQAPLSYTFSYAGAIAWLVVVLVLAAVASFLPAYSAARLSVREVLAYE